MKLKNQGKIPYFAKMKILTKCSPIYFLTLAKYIVTTMMYSNSLICIAIVLVQILRDDILKQAEESRVSSVYLLYIQSKMFGDSAILFVQENAVRRSQFHFQSREYTK